MRRTNTPSHPVGGLFPLLLFGLYLLFLLLILVFSSQTYQTAVKGLEENNNLRTASLYLTAKFRSHDHDGHTIRIAQIEGKPALCLLDTVDGDVYTTYIYLQNGTLKELFTKEGNSPPIDMGTSIADLKSFEITKTPDNFYQFTLTSPDNVCSRLMLHCGNPSENTQNSTEKQ